MDFTMTNTELERASASAGQHSRRRFRSRLRPPAAPLAPPRRPSLPVARFPAGKLRIAAIPIRPPPPPSSDGTTPEVEVMDFNWRWTSSAKYGVPLLIKKFSGELTFVDPRKPAGTHRRGSTEDLGYLMSLMIP
uniref:Uncharacterized protein n=1 Tax=Setaria viridis TaxID=4556 RepID=A0A4U6TMM3_SETVI|nr:hypothetical protein SEVIR_8G202400v2 [Setaria viridis]